jgi:flagellar assembly factor FliW
MMIIETKFFGQMEIVEDSIFTFENGIPGFADHKRFVFVNEDGTVFTYMQSLEYPNTCFVLTDPFAIVKDYDIELKDDTVIELGIENVEDVLLYVILTIPEDIKKMTANMNAPILLNKRNKKGKQELIDNDQYSIRHRIFEGD